MTAQPHDDPGPPTLPGDLCGLYAELAERVAALLDAQQPVDEEQLAAEYPGHEELVRQFVPFLKALHDAGYPADRTQTAGAEHVGAIGDYRIIREIGRGGMGRVYLAEQISLGRHVALKILPFAAVLDGPQLQRFKNEAQAAAMLNHQHIVDVFNFGCERGVYFYAMRYIDGWSLAQVVRQLDRFRRERGHVLSDSVDCLIRISSQEEPSGEEEAADDGNRSTVRQLQAGDTTRRGSHSSSRYHRSIASLAADVADALDHAHQQGIVHRDIKPSNLLLDGQGKVWVTDFGLAQVQSNPALTMTGSLLGTLRYMSPEQAMAKRIPIDHRTDIYSLGATLYELLALRPAVEGDSRERILEAITFSEPKPLRRLDPAIPVDLETIVLKAMQKNPADRYANCGELRDDLRRFLEHKPIQARRQGLAAKTVKWAQRRPAVFALTLALLLLVTVAAFTYSIMLRAHARQLSQQTNQLQRQARQLKAEKKRARRHQQEALQNRDLVGFLLALATRNAPAQKELQNKLNIPEQDARRLSGKVTDRDALRLVSQKVSAITAAQARLTDTTAATRAGRLERARLHVRLAALNAEIGLLARADEQFRTALKVLENLASDFPRDTDIVRTRIELVNDYANLLSRIGHRQQAAQLLEGNVHQAQALRKAESDAPQSIYLYALTRKNLAVVNTVLTGGATALADYREIMPLIDRLLETAAEPRYLDLAAAAKANLADVYRSRGMLDEAEGVIGSAIKSCQDALASDEIENRDRWYYILSEAYYTRAKIREDRALMAQAEEDYRQAVEVLQPALERSPQSKLLQQTAAAASERLGLFLQDRGRLEDAEQQYRSAIERYRALAGQAPHQREYQAKLSGVYDSIAALLQNQGKPQQSVEFYDMAIALRQELVEQDPTSDELRHSLAVVYNNSVGPHMSLNEPDAALRNLNQAVRLHRRNAENSPQVLQYSLDLINSLINRGLLYRDTSRVDAARESLEEALRLLEPIRSAQPENKTAQQYERFAREKLQALQP